MDQQKKATYKYCVVPKCRNTKRNAPDKLFFLIPRGPEIRQKWCEVMNREYMLSATTCLYCCEDHFNIEEDTSNYIQYKIMNLQQQKHKTILRLKKGVLPHKFECQNVMEEEPPTKRKYPQIVKIEGNVSPPFTEEVASPYVGNLNISQLSQNTLQVCPTRLSQMGIQTEIVIKQEIIEDNSFDTMPGSPTQPTILPLCFEPEIKSESVVTDSDFISGSSRKVEAEKQFENYMRSCTLLAIKKESKILLGLPKECYHLIESLSESIPIPTIDILITLKKIKLNESFSILALQFGYTQSEISTIFFKTLPLLAEQMKQTIVWPTHKENLKDLPVSPAKTNIVSIVDFLEIHIEKPPDAVHDYNWVKDNQCNILKYLISCTPDCLVNFVSLGFSGKARNEIIVEDCGFLDCLPSKATVMADTGFQNASYLLEKKECTLLKVTQPPSILSVPKNITKAKKISALRIHIRNVINKLREFHMLLLHTYIDHNLIPVMDDVIVIACGLINTQGEVIKK